MPTVTVGEMEAARDDPALAIALAKPVPSGWDAPAPPPEPVRAPPPSEDPVTVVGRYRHRIKKCYANQLARDPTLSGALRATIEIDGATGTPTVSVTSDTLPPELLKCIGDVLKSLRFGPTADGESISIVVPIVLKSG